QVDLALDGHITALPFVVRLRGIGVVLVRQIDEDPVPGERRVVSDVQAFSFEDVDAGTHRDRAVRKLRDSVRIYPRLEDAVAAVTHRHAVDRGLEESRERIRWRLPDALRFRLEPVAPHTTGDEDLIRRR